MKIMIIMGAMFLGSVQPILMIFSLIMITFLYSLYLYKLMGSYWFSYMLIMIMLSGVLVVFTYMASLIPNESFEIYNLIFVVLFVIMFFMDEYNFFGEDMSFITMNLWIKYVGLLNLFLVSFLLSIMLMVVWVSNMDEGAVRNS